MSLVFLFWKTIWSDKTSGRIKEPAVIHFFTERKLGSKDYFGSKNEGNIPKWLRMKEKQNSSQSEGKDEFEK
jgi:hypothetical protein